MVCRFRTLQLASTRIKKTFPTARNSNRSSKTIFLKPHTLILWLGTLLGTARWYNLTQTLIIGNSITYWRAPRQGNYCGEEEDVKFKQLQNTQLRKTELIYTSQETCSSSRTFLLQDIPSSGTSLPPRYSFLRNIPSSGTFLPPGYSFLRDIPSSGTFLPPGHSFLQDIPSSGTFLPPELLDFKRQLRKWKEMKKEYFNRIPHH